jgi:putative FmdB family regulatory protein
MPLYAYRCTACGAQEEHIQRFSDPPKQHCEVCGGALEKQLGGASFHLKGGGWYKDGYASSKPGASEGSSSGSDGGSSSGGDGGGSSTSPSTGTGTGTGAGTSTSKPDSGGSSGGGTDKGKSAKAAGE